MVIHEGDGDAECNIEPIKSITTDTPVRECMKDSDDHEGNLSGEENSNDHDEHHGGAVSISVLSLSTILNLSTAAELLIISE